MRPDRQASLAGAALSGTALSGTALTGTSLIHEGACWLWRDDRFEADALWPYLHPEGDFPEGTRIQTGGRGAAWNIEIAGEKFVCRHYRRGGMMARISSDLYVWTGLDHTRAYREFAVMRRAAQAGLAVPKPAAAMVCRVSGLWGLGSLFYRASILTPRIDHVGSLAKVASESGWFNAGRAIAQMHAAGIWHADLNVHNILLDAQDRAWLIDFDRAQEGVTDSRQLQGNLSRLLRSVNKVCPALGQRFWSVLCDGYGQG
ncbi:MAG TPA: 3-deoxy-D-manno-octulosonic acid kinase [Orrella sp.]